MRISIPCSGEKYNNVQRRRKGANIMFRGCEVEMDPTLKWALVAAGWQRRRDCLPDWCQEVWSVVQPHCPVGPVGGEDEVEEGWWRESAMLWYRMGPIRTLAVHRHRPGHTSNDPIRSRQQISIWTTFLYDRSKGVRYDRFYDDKLVAPEADLLRVENCA